MSFIPKSIIVLFLLFLLHSLSSFILNRHSKNSNKNKKYCQKYSLLNLNGGSSRYGYSDEEDYSKIREIEEPEDENNEESNDDIDLDEEDKEDDTNSGIQFMITKKMKKILIDELGYLSNEVEEMEPQVIII